MYRFEAPIGDFFKKLAPDGKKDDAGIESATFYEFEKPTKASCPVAGIEMLVEEITGSKSSGVLVVKSNNGRSYKVNATDKLSICAVPEESKIARVYFPKEQKNAETTKVVAEKVESAEGDKSAPKDGKKK